MTIASQLEALTTNLAAAKGAVTAKGGTVGDTGLAGLASEIGTIPTGQSGPLDPAVVYANNRPSTWLQMPSDANVADGEVYYLLEVDTHRTKDLIFGVHHDTGNNSVKYDIDFGVVVDGVFVADSSYYVHDLYNQSKNTISVPMSIFRQAGSEKQIIMRAKTQSGSFKNVNDLFSGDKAIVEVKGKSTTCESFRITASQLGVFSPTRLRYFTLLGTNSITSCSYMFAFCESLEAVVSLDTSHASQFNNMFRACYGLVAIPSINLSNATSCNYMFADCKRIQYIPDLSAPSATDFSYMFNGCPELRAVPQLITTSGTTFSNMFNGCYSLETVTSFDTSHATNMEGMFYSCLELQSVPLFNTSSVTTMKSMFYSCFSLHDVPLFDTSSVTLFSQMFASCYTLKTAPAFDTSSGTNFSGMFNLCHSLEENPQYDISHATNVSYMFDACSGLEYVDISNYNFSSVTDASYFIYGSYLLGGGNIYLPGINKFPAAGIPVGSSSSNAPFAMSSGSSDYAAFNAVNMIITEDSGMIPVQGDARRAFGNSQYNPTVYVPDSLYATYASDSNWSQLGARLKKMSDLPA